MGPMVDQNLAECTGGYAALPVADGSEPHNVTPRARRASINLVLRCAEAAANPDDG
jgi:hypothetical protein